MTKPMPPAGTGQRRKKKVTITVPAGPAAKGEAVNKSKSPDGIVLPKVLQFREAMAKHATPPPDDLAEDDRADDDRADDDRADGDLEEYWDQGSIQPAKMLAPVPTPLTPVQREPFIDRYPNVPALMKKLRKDKVLLATSRVFRILAGSGDGCLLLGQLMYWFDSGEDGNPRARAFTGRPNERVRWCAKTHEQWADETGIPPRQIPRILARLERLGLIQTIQRKFRGVKMTHAHPRYENICQAIDEQIDKQQRSQ